MKKALSLLLGLALICSLMGFSASAEETGTATVDYEYLDDGSYIVTTIEERPQLTRATNTKSGSKKATYYNSNNVAQWSLTVSGTFSYTGYSAKATSVSSTRGYHVTGCTLLSLEEYTSGSKALAKASVNCKSTTTNLTLSLNCSPTGTLS